MAETKEKNENKNDPVSRAKTAVSKLAALRSDWVREEYYRQTSKRNPLKIIARNV